MSSSRRARHSAKLRTRARKAEARAEAGTRRLLTHRGIVFTLILAGLLFSSVYPMRRYFAVRSSIASLQQEERRLDRTAAVLATEKQRLLGDEAVERIARDEYGMVRVGEVPFVVIQPGAHAKKVQRPPVVEDAATAALDTSLWSGVLRTIRRATRSLR
jgi:cell division protein FtsB